jgi:DNA-binding FadR family transcriptional regulator
MLGTSRTPVREAMKILQALGGLEIKRGDGTYISTSITPNTIQSLIFNLILQRGTPAELVELRLFFEEAYIKWLLQRRQRKI